MVGEAWHGWLRDVCSRPSRDDQSNEGGGVQCSAVEWTGRSGVGRSGEGGLASGGGGEMG